ncbi:MAG: copper amine oxidase N-terminal domain-containing protein [Firmicutes bacterium]|nr:copper amine oxidase N-terminal domain-containing protein [Bacillota bacterium]
MKNKNKILIFAIIFLLMLSGASFAQEITKNIEVLFTNVIIEVNGNKLEVEDKPFVYKNRIYAPVRDIVEGINGEVNWNEEENKVKISNYKDFPECDYLEGEQFIYGLITNINYDKETIEIEQHLDDNSPTINPVLEIERDVVIILQRNDKKMNLEVEDLKIGEDVGLVITNENRVRGIILSK